MSLGSGPILSLNFLDTTIAASLAGTAAATTLNSSLTCTFAKSFSVYNNTKRDLELIIGAADPGTAAYGGIFVPGDTTAHFTNGFLHRQPIAVQQGYKLFARTMANTPVTVSATLFLRIDFWA